MTVALFSLDEMLEAAQRATGLTDWGDDDIQLPLHVFVRALNEEAQVTELGRVRTRAYIDMLLTGRLRLFEDRKRYPEIDRQQICQPIFMAGMPRAGTSFLNSLISCDSQILGLREWQSKVLSPPGNHPKYDHELQIAEATRFLSDNGWLHEDVRKKIDKDPLLAAEDIEIQDFGFLSETFYSMWDVPSYAVFYATADRGPAYRIEKKVLQSLQFGVEGKRWLLKGPRHISQLDLLHGTFPGTQMVINHRDPIKVLPSLASLTAALRKVTGNRPVVADRAFSLAMMEDMATGFENMMRRRKDERLNKSFVDVNYVDLERNPIKQVEKVYDRFGMILTSAARDKMKSFIAQHRKGKFGVHRYRIEDTGLSVDEVRDRFASYLRRFDIPLED
jgi:Sulfotransferase family